MKAWIARPWARGPVNGFRLGMIRARRQLVMANEQNEMIAPINREPASGSGR